MTLNNGYSRSDRIDAACRNRSSPFGKDEPETDRLPATTEVSTDTTTTQAALVTIDETVVSPVDELSGVHLALASQPERPNGLAPARVAISTGLAVAVLVVAALIRRPEEP